MKRPDVHDDELWLFGDEVDSGTVHDSVLIICGSVALVLAVVVIGAVFS